MSDVEKEVAALKEQTKTLFEKQREHSRLLESIHTLSQSVSVMEESMKHLQEDVKWLRSDVDQLEGVPGKRWDGVVSGIIGAVVGGIVMYVMARIGLG